MRHLPNYIYRAVDKTGKHVKGKIEAPNKEAVTSIIKSKGMYIVSLDEENIFNSKIDMGSNRTISYKKVGLFARQFSMLLKAGISISASLDILKEQLEDKAMVEISNSMYQDVQRGISLSEAMAKTEKLPQLLVNTIEAGETGGFLDEVMEQMAVYYEKDTKIVSKVRGALIYPAMVLLVTLVVTYILLTQVVPQFAEMFESMDIELPLLTKILMNTGLFMNANGILLGAIMVVLISGLVWYLRTPAGKFKKDVILLSIPIIKNIVLKSVVARFARTMSIMLKTGIPMISAIEHSSKVLGNEVIKKGIAIVKEDVSTGSSLATPIQEMKLFPKLVVSMIKIGEETGALDEMMSRCANYYDSEVEELSSRVTALIEPFIILILAGIVGTIVMAVIIPMFQMYSAI